MAIIIKTNFSFAEQSESKKLFLLLTFAKYCQGLSAFPDDSDGKLLIGIEDSAFERHLDENQLQQWLTSNHILINQIQKISRHAFLAKVELPRHYYLYQLLQNFFINHFSELAESKLFFTKVDDHLAKLQSRYMRQMQIWIQHSPLNLTVAPYQKQKEIAQKQLTLQETQWLYVYWQAMAQLNASAPQQLDFDKIQIHPNHFDHNDLPQCLTIKFICLESFPIEDQFIVQLYIEDDLKNLIHHLPSGIDYSINVITEGFILNISSNYLSQIKQAICQTGLCFDYKINLDLKIKINSAHA